MPWGWDLIPGINVGNSIKNIPKNVGIKMNGGDPDWVDGVSDKGGERNPTGPTIAGVGYSPQSSGTSSSKPTKNDVIPPKEPKAPAQPAYDPAAAAQAASDAREKANTIGMLDSELEAIGKSLGNLDNTWKAGKTSLQDFYDKGVSRLNESRSNELGRFSTMRADSKQAFNRSLEDNDNQTYNNFQALQSLLGRSGAGSSSAAQNVVPYAVSQTASKARGSIADSYGKNMRDLSTSEDEAEQMYLNSKRDLEDNNRTKLGELESDIQGKRSAYESNRAKLLGQKKQAEGGDWKSIKDAMNPAIAKRDEIDRALSTLLDRYRNPYQVQDVKVKDPTLSNYAVDTNGVRVDEGTGTDTDTSADYLARIRDEEERKKQQASLAIA